MFLLDPLDRASRRRELLDNLPPPANGWEQAARQLEQQYPSLAALEPALVERLGTWSRRIKLAAAAGARPAPTWGFQTQGGLQMPQVRRPVRAASARQRVPLWPLLLVVLIAGRLVTGPLDSGRSYSPPQNYTTPRYSAPSYSPPRSAVPSTRYGDPLRRDGTAPARPDGPSRQPTDADIREAIRLLRQVNPTPSPGPNGGPP